MMHFIQSRLGRVVIFSMIGILFGVLVAIGSILWDRQTNTVISQPDLHADSVNLPIQNLANIGGTFNLTDMNGRKVTEKNYAGKFKIIYFGFTYCPTICPTELQKMAGAYAQLNKSQQDQINMIFITIDPERDTVPVMKDYVSLFHANLIGLTGTAEQVKSVKSEYKIYAAKIPQNDSYTMDHSSFIYLFDRDNKIQAIFRSTDTEKSILDKLINIIG